MRKKISLFAITVLLLTIFIPRSFAQNAEELAKLQTEMQRLDGRLDELKRFSETFHAAFPGEEMSKDVIFAIFSFDLTELELELKLLGAAIVIDIASDKNASEDFMAMQEEIMREEHKTPMQYIKDMLREVEEGITSLERQKTELQKMLNKR